MLTNGPNSLKTLAFMVKQKHIQLCDLDLEYNYYTCHKNPQRAINYLTIQKHIRAN